MFLKGKRMAFLGLLLSIVIILIILSSIFEFNTLFLLAGASFGVGIAVRECGIRLGFGFYIASMVLGFILAPNKIYCISYGAFALYILLREVVWEVLANGSKNQHKTTILWFLKYIVFNMMYVPLLVWAPSLIYQGTIRLNILIALWAAGQVALYLFDYIYAYFQQRVWGKVRGKFGF